MTEHTIILNAKHSEIPYASVLAITAGGYNPELSVNLSNDIQPGLNINGYVVRNDITIARIISQSLGIGEFNGITCFERAKIDEVLTLCERVVDGFLGLEEVLHGVQLSECGTLFENRITVADIALWSLIIGNTSLQKNFTGLFNAVLKDCRFLRAHMMIGKFVDKIIKPEIREKQKDEGKFVDLPGAKKGNVIVRFPPEASGYLHIGHAKAALLNQYYQQEFDGKLILRFDDTNPAKENAHFEKVIEEDLALLNVIPHCCTHTSDYFEIMLEMCERLLREGKAYIDDTDLETMRKEREERIASKNRCLSHEKNLLLWEEMKKGSEKGKQCCVRIKIDFQSKNGALRDPTIYRCKPEEHIRTGTKYKVYPTYDFACPIVDSLEGVTHALRTTEYHDRDDQYYFICDALGLRKPHIWSYSRLNMTNTVMSKRKLTWFVSEGLVEGWDDPRLPTVRGVIRHGMTVEGLRQFIIAQGGSRSVVMMEWDKIWSFNKKVIDPIAPRYTALETTSLVPVYISTPVVVEEVQVPLHPKNADIGSKGIWRSSKLLVEQADALEIKCGETVTFVNWGNIRIISVERSHNNVKEIHAVLDLANQDFKKTMKVTWIAEAESHAAACIPVVAAEYDHIISKAIVGKDEDWQNFINCNSVRFLKMLGEPALRSVKKGDIIQIQRKGFYICDHAYQEKSVYSGFATPLLLIYIPDGHTKDNNRSKQKNDKDHIIEQQPADSKDSTSFLSKGVSNGIHKLYDEIYAQGEVVRVEKAKNPKSEESMDAVAKLLELKRQYKEKTGSEYKAGQPPTVNSSLPPQDTISEITALYEEIFAQGEVVRNEKARNAKSEESIAAIARLLDLKKQYREKTGREYKAGEPSIISAVSSEPPTISAVSSGQSPSSEIKGLYEEIRAQGELVRQEKAKNPKSEASANAIAKLLELKKLYKEKTGQDYKPV